MTTTTTDTSTQEAQHLQLLAAILSDVARAVGPRDYTTPGAELMVGYRQMYAKVLEAAYYRRRPLEVDPLPSPHVLASDALAELRSHTGRQLTHISARVTLRHWLRDWTGSSLPGEIITALDGAADGLAARAAAIDAAAEVAT